jgi:glycosyltransferase involved in cell wall biosynthesis
VPRPPLTKRPIILAVGRFFDPASGHGKHQLELVDAFRSLGEAGWTLHLVGGCEPEGERYLARVRAAADGLPVHLHPDASGAELRALYGSASLFWHATGLGEDRGRPERFEHFGITTVEAMSAGAVPLVFAGGGQLEVVEPGRSGRFWSTPAELVAATRELIADPARRTAMAGAARRAAERFAPAVFASSLTAIVDDVVRGAGPSGEVGGRPDAGSTGQTEDASRAGSRWGGDPWA